MREVEVLNPFLRLESQKIFKRKTTVMNVQYKDEYEYESEVEALSKVKNLLHFP